MSAEIGLQPERKVGFTPIDEMREILVKLAENENATGVGAEKERANLNDRVVKVARKIAESRTLH